MFLMYSIAGVLRGTSKRKLYQELSRDPLQLRSCYRKSCGFYKFYKNKSPQYLSKLASLRQTLQITKNAEEITFLKT